MRVNKREPWIDAVRAIAVILVVLFHFLLWTHTDIAGKTAGLAGTWGDLQEVLGRLRMPLLMAISGLLAASAIQRGWVAVRLRLVANYWIYVVWLTIFWIFYTVIYRVVADPRLPEGVQTFEKFLRNLVMPSTALWFIAAMAIFPVLIWLCERFDIPIWLVLIAAVTIWAFGTYGGVPQWFGKFSRTFVFFAAGYYGRTAVPYFSKRGWPSAVVAFGTFVLASVYFRRMFDVQLGVFLAALLAIMASFMIGPLLFTSGVHTRVASMIGKRTLEIPCVSGLGESTGS